MANEKRLIDADALIRTLDQRDKKNSAYNLIMSVIIGIIDRQPTVDAVEVVHAKWIDAYGIRKSKCNHCGVAFCRVMEDCDYCPNCGAKMDGGNEDV